MGVFGPIGSGEFGHQTYLTAHPAVERAAPVALGDTIQGYPLVGTTYQLIADLAEVNDATVFTETFQIMAGSETPSQPGDTLFPQHSLNIDDAVEHAGAEFAVIRRFAPTGTPWDHAYMAPIEAINGYIAVFVRLSATACYLMAVL